MATPAREIENRSDRDPRGTRSQPVLIDTDMGLDDAVGLCLALASPSLDVRAVVGVGGRVELDGVMSNIERVLSTLKPARSPEIGCGVTSVAGNLEAGRGTSDVGSACAAGKLLDVYRRAIESSEGELVVLAFGPLTNIAAVLAEPGLARGIRRIVVSGGAVWTKGNAGDKAEFNFHRDPLAAAKVVGAERSGVDATAAVTVCPLDVTRLVTLDESHVAHLAASEGRAGPLLAELLKEALAVDDDAGVGRVQIQDAVATGALLWPNLFLKTRMRLEIVVEGSAAGQSLPKLGGDASQRIDLLTAVNAVDLLENLLECLCQESFVV